MKLICPNCGMEVEMGIAGVGGVGGDADVASGIDADVGQGLMGLEGGVASGAPISGPDVSAGGTAEPVAAIKEAPKPKKPVAEKVAGVQRKARRRSLLSGEGEENQVYRRSILGR